MGKMQKYLAEVLGTFALVGVGSFAIVSFNVGGQAFGGAGIVSIALGFGLALLIGLYAFGEVSGGHFNPVVSLAMFLDRRLTLDDMIGYWIAQLVGAILASIVVLIAYDDAVVATTTTQASDTWAAIVVEVVLSALFIAVILHSTVSERYERDGAPRDPADARRDPRRRDPDQRRLRQPGAEPRAGAGRHGVQRHLDLPDRAADRRDPRLDRVQGRRSRGHELPRRHRRHARRPATPEVTDPTPPPGRAPDA